MKARSIQEIANLPAAERVAGIVEGLEIIAEHVDALRRSWKAHEHLQDRRGLDSLGALAAEESAKFMVIFDALRFGEQRQQELFEQLSRTGSHIAKGIYAECYEHSHYPFAEVLECVDRQRQQFYLDGPNNVDWIFRNAIESDREERMYVDYVITDDGAYWSSPSQFDSVPSYWRWIIVDLVLALRGAGVVSAEGMSIARSHWHDVDVDPTPLSSSSFQDGKFVGPKDDRRERNKAMIDSLKVAGLAAPQFSSDDEQVIIHNLTYPMNTADMKRIPVDQNDLRHFRNNYPLD